MAPPQAILNYGDSAFNLRITACHFASKNPRVLASTASSELARPKGFEPLSQDSLPNGPIGRHLTRENNSLAFQQMCYMMAISYITFVGECDANIG
jgi:hypothetical protein